MKNKQKRGSVMALLIVIIAILIIGIIYFYTKDKASRSIPVSNPQSITTTETTGDAMMVTENNLATITASSSTPVSDVSIQEGSSLWKDKTGTCSITLKYPVVAGLSNISTQTSINEYLKNMFVSLETASQLTDENGNPVLPSTYNYTCDFYNNTSYKVTLKKDTLLSIQYSYSTGYNGVAMHPYTMPSGVTIDLATGHILHYADLFKTDEQSLSVMKNAITVAVNSKYDTAGFDSSYSPEIISTFWQQSSSDIKFYLTPAQIVFFDYKADPSIPSFSIDYSTVKSITLDQRI